MITTQNIYDILSGIAEKVNDTPIPEEAIQYTRLRNKAKERIHNEAHDTAHMHSMYVMDSAMLSQVDTMDDIGWEILYSNVSERENIPLSFARGLSYNLNPDPMVKKIYCKVEEKEIENNQRILIGIVFDGVKKGFWELDDAKAFADKKCPDIPYFDKDEWVKTLSQLMGGHVVEDLVDTDIPEGGDDVYLL